MGREWTKGGTYPSKPLLTRRARWEAGEAKAVALQVGFLGKLVSRHKFVFGPVARHFRMDHAIHVNIRLFLLRPCKICNRSSPFSLGPCEFVLVASHPQLDLAIIEPSARHFHVDHAIFAPV